MRFFTKTKSVSLRSMALLGFVSVALLLPMQLVQKESKAASPPMPTAPVPIDEDGLSNLDFESGTDENGFPKDWYGGGMGYELTVSEDAHSGSSCGQIKMVGKKNARNFGTYTGGFKPDKFHGKRVKFSGFLKSDMGEDAWAGMWMRVDGEKASLGFDNMKNRPVKGKTDWTEYSIVLDISEEATNINFGFLISGKGTIWGDDLKFEVVGDIGEGPEPTDFYADGKEAAKKKVMETRKAKTTPVNMGFDETTNRNWFAGWFGGGKGFKVTPEKLDQRTGKGCVRMERVDDGADFCGASQFVSATNYRGKTIRLTGFIKTKGVTDGGAGLWMRIDAPKRNTVGFDNMSDRPILGATPWTEYQIDMEVPDSAIEITFGVLLKGGGIAWADDFKLEVIEKE